ncbi:hypothetical protein LB519_11835 [Mesorhizobium sp. AD1-1]|uniref:hypothetical protein n=1 Tax=Mesorhizobium sp. AD1-1 TaxID=2876621 RepID=UPI001CCD9348|nr:hypothetical protein [Mesorhizobium sp. AD1-1]MBZ9718542.1 hypothetical protein [Mesorhizobium sp. AD1-1]
MDSPALINSSYLLSVHNQRDLLRLPRRIAADRLEAIPESYRMAYIEDENGKGYFLSTQTADVIRDGEAEIARINAEMEDIPARVERERKAWRNDAVNDAIQSSLKKAGVKEGLLEGAMSMLKKENSFEVDPSDDGRGFVVTGRNAYGLCEVDSLVVKLVGGDEGAVWRERKPNRFDRRPDSINQMPSGRGRR